MSDPLRTQIVNLLEGKGAHAPFLEAAADFPVHLRGVKPDGAPHTAWMLVEHLRIAQWDILEFSRNPNHESPKFPDGYWPDSEAPKSAQAWDKSVSEFEAGRKAMQQLIGDESRDLFAPLPHGEGQTLLREALVLADHNAYHIGQLLFLRKLLGAWHAA